MKWAVRALHILLIIGFLFVGILSIFVFILPYGTLKAIGDLLSPDRNLESLTPALILHFKNPSFIFGLILTSIGFFLLVWWRKTQSLIEKAILQIRHHGGMLLKDGRAFLDDIWAGRPNRKDGFTLIAIVILAAFLRIILINRPIEYDEAYTFVEFAQHSFKQILINYNVPNNHVFHTILVRLSYLVFGNGLWQIRLPTFIASLLLVISMFFLARNYYDWKTGIITAILSATIPSVVLRSVSARGYIIVTLMMVVALLLADYVRQQKNKVGWIILALACAIGFFTIPVMLYPSGFVFIWLLYLGFTKQFSKEYTHLGTWIKYLFITGFLVIAITALFYSPIFLNSDVNHIYSSNRVLQPTSFNEFLASAPVVLRGLMSEWQSGINPVLWFIFIMGLILSIVPNRSISKYRTPMLIIFSPYLLAMLFLLRPYPIARIWLWMFPLFMLWSAAGISGAFHWMAKKLSKPYISYGLTGIFVLGLAINGIFAVKEASLHDSYVEDPAAVPVVTFLKSRVSSDDLVVVSDCSNARYWYYLSATNIPDQVLRNRDRFFARVYVIAYTKANPSCGNELMESVLNENGPDSVFLDRSKIDLVFKYKYASVYEIGTFPERIHKAYPTH